jgi:hypothetical protein
MALLSYNSVDKDSIDAKLRALTVDMINTWFKDGEITGRDKHDMLIAKSHAELQGVIAKEGIPGAYFVEVVKQAGKGWENIKNMIGSATTSASEQELTIRGQVWNILKGFYGGLQIALSPLAVFEVGGQQAEDLALEAGASPGQARMLNIIVKESPMFIPFGLAAKGLQKTVAAVGGTAKAVVDVKGAQVIKEALEEVRVAKTVSEGLVLDGVKEAPKIIERSIKEIDPELANIVQQAIKSDAAFKEFSSVAKEELRPFLETAARFTKRITADNAANEVQTLAKKFGIDPNMLQIPSGPARREALTDRQLYGYLKALEEHSTNLSTLAKEAVSGDRNAQIRFMKYASDFFNPGSGKPVIETSFKDMLMYWDPENIARGNVMGAMESFAQAMIGLSESNLAKLAFNNQQGFINFGSTFNAPRLKELYANMLLPLASPAAALGNSLATGVHLLETGAGGVFGRNEITMLDPMFAAFGMKHAFKDSMFAAKEALMERNPFVGGGRFPQFQAWQGVLGEAIRKPGDLMIATDEFYNTILYRASLYEQLGAEAHRHGMTFEQAGQWIELHMSNPSMIPQRIYEMARDIAQVNTFQNQLPKWAEHIQQGVQMTPAFFYFPFMKSFMNLLRYSYDRTPGLQLFQTQLYKNLAAGGRRADMTIGRLTISNMFGHYLYELAKEGFIDGSGPVDPRLRVAWIAAGHEPQSIKTPFGRMSFRNMEPLTQVLGSIADLAAIADQISDTEFEQAVLAAMYAIAANFVDTGSFHTVARLTDAIEGVRDGRLKQTARDALMAPFTTMVTGGPLVLRTKNIIDPIARDTTNYIDSLKARVPGFSKDVPPVRWQSPYGDIKIPPTTPGTNWFGYFSPLAPKIKPEINDSVATEGERLQIASPRFSRNLGGTAFDPQTDLRKAPPGTKLGTTLTPGEFDHRLQIYNKLVRDAKEGVLSLQQEEEYQNAPVARQRQMFEDFLHQKWDQSGLMIQQMNPAIEQRVRASTLKSILPLLDEADKAQVKEDLSPSAPTLFEELDETELQNLMKFGYVKPQEAKLPLRQDIQLERSPQ